MVSDLNILFLLGQRMTRRHFIWGARRDEYEPTRHLPPANHLGKGQTETNVSAPPP